MIHITVIHGPNLNMLGKRERSIYGEQSLAELNEWLKEKHSDCVLNFFQSNAEAVLIEKIHSLKSESQKADAIVINAAAFTHTSVALRDALLAVDIPFMEVHLSNVYKRESFRSHSFLSDVAVGVVSGLGKYSYSAAIEYFKNSAEDV